jgi:hypothetical protein
MGTSPSHDGRPDKALNFVEDMRSAGLWRLRIGLFCSSPRASAGYGGADAGKPIFPVTAEHVATIFEQHQTVAPNADQFQEKQL